MVILDKVQLATPLAGVLALLYPRLQVPKLELGWLEALITRNLRPKLIRAVLQRMVANWLPLAIS